MKKLQTIGMIIGILAVAMIGAKTIIKAPFIVITTLVAINIVLWGMKQIKTKTQER